MPPLAYGADTPALHTYTGFYDNWRAQNPYAGEIPIFDEKSRSIIAERNHRSKKNIKANSSHENLSRWAQIGVYGSTGTSTLNTAAQVGSSSPGFAGAVATAIAAGGVIAISSTGIGLLVVSGVLIVTQGALAYRSRLRTIVHIEALTQIFYAYHTDRDKIASMEVCPYVKGRDSDEALDYEAEVDKINRSYGFKLHAIKFNNPANHDLHGKSVTPHNIILNSVLPFIIEQKKRKLSRKTVVAGGAVLIGAGGLFETARGTLRTIQKHWQGTKAEHRTNAALFLAYHYQTMGCNLTTSIIVQLFSSDYGLIINSMSRSEAEALDGHLDDLRHMPLERLKDLLMEKLNSSG